MSLKIHFCYDTTPPELLLHIYSKMTPQRSGRWKDMVGVLSPDDADFIIIIDKCKHIANAYPPEKLIYIGSHYKGIPNYQCFDGVPCAASLDLAKDMGFNEWWINYSYDELVDMKPAEKTKDLIAIVSDTQKHTYQKLRKNLIYKICERSDLIGFFELYGRMRPTGCTPRYHKGPLGENSKTDWMSGKEGVYKAARYALELDGGPAINYVSERFFDALLLWAMPLYWGGTDIEKFFPEKSFQYIDIHGDGSDAIDIARTDFREQNLDAIAEARNLILNEYQIWPTVYRVIKNL
jgi:hypothetical protein